MNLLYDLINDAALNIDEAWWAVEPMFLFALHWLGIAACSFIVGSVCCRVDAMRSRVTSKWWAASFIGYGIFGMGTLIDLTRDLVVDWYELFGAFAIAVYLLKTRHLWKNGQPTETESRWHLFGDKE